VVTTKDHIVDADDTVGRGFVDDFSDPGATCERLWKEAADETCRRNGWKGVSSTDPEALQLYTDALEDAYTRACAEIARLRVVAVDPPTEPATFTRDVE
jgi:hypothetical protein